MKKNNTGTDLSEKNKKNIGKTQILILRYSYENVMITVDSNI